MDSKGFKLTKESFLLKNVQKKNIVDDFAEGANLAAIEEEERQREAQARNEWLLSENEKLHNTLNTQNRMSLDDYAARKQITYIDNLLSDMQTTQDLHVTKEQQDRLHSIKSRTLINLLLRQGGSDSPEMREIKNGARELENLLAARKDDALTPEIFEQIEIGYKTVVASCVAYLENPKKRENRRKALVREVWTALSFEADRLTILHKGVENGEHGEKTVGEFLSLDTDMTVRETNERRETGPKQRPKISENGAFFQKLFSERFHPNERIKKAESSKSGRLKVSKAYLEMKEILKTFPMGEVVVRDVTILGKKARLVQRSDNTLMIVENGNRYVLDTTAQYAADRIESDMASEGELYGEKAMDTLFTGYDPENAFNDPGEIQRKRQVMVTYIEKVTGVPGAELANVPIEAVRNYAIEASRLSLTAEDIRSTLELYQDRQYEMINTEESRKLMVREKDDERVEMRLQNEEKFMEEKDEDEEDEDYEARSMKSHHWRKQEKQLLDFVADLVFDQQTWTADEKEEKQMAPGERMRTLLTRHVEAVRFLIKKPDEVKLMIEKLPLPQIMIEDKETKEKMTLKDSMKRGLDKMRSNPAIFILSYLPDKVWFTNEDKFGNVVKALGKEDLPDDLNGIDVSQIKDAFDSMGDNLEEMVDSFTENLQTTMKDVVKNIFGNDGEEEEEDDEELIEIKEENEQKDEAKEKNDRNLKEIRDREKEVREKEKEQNDLGKSELRKIMEDCARGEKGIGKFNKTVMKTYFTKVGTLDKRAMISSMIRGLKPAASMEVSKGELLTELKEMYLQSGSRLFMNAGEQPLTEEEQAIFNTYANQKREDNIAANIMGGVLKGAGPLMQKMMQGLPLESLPEGIRKAVKDMKSNLNPIPEPLVKAAMDGIVARSKNAIKKLEVVKSLGAASVGQAFLCKMYDRHHPDGVNVVVKLLRPDVRNRMMREEDIMLNAAAKTDAGMLATYKGQLKNIKKELDLTLEARNVEAGEVYMNRHADVTSMQLNYIVEPTANTMIAECAEGTTVDKYLDGVAEKIESVHSRFYKKEEDDDDPDAVKKTKYMTFTPENAHLVKGAREELQAELKKLEKMRDHVCSLCDIWVRQGMLEKGFYHGDLHAGNIMISEEKATVIDYGNAVQLTERQQKWIIGMLTAAIAGDGDLFAEGFEKLLDKADDARFMKTYNQKKAELVATFRDVLSKGTQEEAGERIMVALLKAQELGIEIPDAIYNFAQGQIRLMNTVNEMNEMMATLQREINRMGNLQPGARTIRANPLLMAQKRITKSMFGTETYQKGIYTTMIDSLKPVSAEEVATEVSDRKKQTEFEEKYMKPYRHIKDFLAGKNIMNVDDDEEDDEENAVQDIPAEELKPFDYQGRAKKLRKFINDYKDKVGTKELMNEANRLLGEINVMEASTGALDAFGGKTLLLGKLADAMNDMDLPFLNRVIDVFENQLPKAKQMLDKYDELREAQRRKSRNVGQLKQEFAELFAEVEKGKVSNCPIMLETMGNLHQKTVQYSSGKVGDNRVEILEELQGMFAETYQPEGAEESIGQTMKKAYDRLEAAEKKEEQEKTDEARTERVEAETAFLEEYRKVAVYQLTHHRDTTYANMTKAPKENDFLKVMEKILAGRVKMAISSLPKVGLGLGVKMLITMMKS
ncbi:MAG: hypothetical protein K6F53_07375 [Lachnospiraceae bacterium]|nr:hypothetical protein [Lachnospiraceae bacterium]